MIIKFLQLLKRCYKIAIPFGKKRLYLLMVIILANGIFEIIGVTSIFPFLALATNPEAFQEHQLYQYLPDLPHQSLLWLMGLFSVCSLFIANTLGLISQVFRVRYGHFLGHSLRKQLLTASVQRDYQFFTNSNSAHLIQRIILDTQGFANQVFTPLLDVIAKSCIALILITVVFITNPVIAMITATTLILFYVSSILFFRRKSLAIGNIWKETNAGIMKSSQQLFGAIKTIILRNNQAYFTESILKHSEKQARMVPYTTLYTMAPRSLIEPIALGGIIIATLVVSSGGTDIVKIIPTLSVMAVASVRLLPAFQGIYSQLNQLASRYYTLPQIEEDIKSSSDIADSFQYNEKVSSLNLKGDIVLDNVSFTYPQATTPTLSNLNLTIKENSFIGITGPTGSGKSTLIDLVLGLHQPTEGSLLVNGHIIDQNNIKYWRNGIGYVPQEIFLLDDSIAKNIAFGITSQHIKYDRLREVASAARILDFIETDLPEGFNTKVGERGVRLSGGQRQRIGLARALYHRPKILVLDEATSALDHHIEQEVMEAIHALQGRLTIISIAHRLSTLDKADKIIEITKKQETKIT